MTTSFFGPNRKFVQSSGRKKPKGFDHRIAMRKKPSRTLRSKAPKKRFAKQPVSLELRGVHYLLRATAKALKGL